MASWRWAYVATLVMAAASIACIILFGSPPDMGSAPMADGFSSPILALELARTSQDLAFLQGPDAAGLRAYLVGVQALDWYFPPAYAGMAAAFFLAASLERGPMPWKPVLAWIGLALAVVTIPADYLENRVINQILADLGRGEDPSGRLGALQVATWLKWSAIGLYSLVTSLALVSRGRRILAVPGVLAALSVAAAFLVLPNGQGAEVMAILLIPSFLVYPVAAVLQLRRR